MPNSTLPVASTIGLTTCTSAPDRHPAAVYLARLGPGSRRAQRGALDTMARALSGGRAGVEELPWHELEYQHTLALRTVLVERYSPATANRHLAALRGVLREAWRLGLMTAEDFQRAIDLSAVRGERLPRGRALSRGELRALFESCRNGRPSDLRDAALIGVLYAAGVTPGRGGIIWIYPIMTVRPVLSSSMVRGTRNGPPTSMTVLRKPWGSG